jgi:transposase
MNNNVPPGLGGAGHGILWVLRTGAPWKDLPERYPPYQTCHRRFQQWRKNGTIERVLYTLAEGR